MYCFIEDAVIFKMLQLLQPLTFPKSLKGTKIELFNPN
jgi:hypothetical protein